jgi:hypothetical protein
MDKVYVLTNQAMPDLVKIGVTSSDDVETRMQQLDSTGVPLPFECYYAAEVEDATAVEKALHTAFTESRVRRNREFFEIDPNRAKVIIELLAVRDVTPREQVVEFAQDTDALVRNANKRGLFSFESADVPVGAILNFSRDESRTATVLDDNNIAYDGEETSLSRSALKIMHELGYNWKTIDGTSFWLYQGQTLNERRRELREAQEDAQRSSN